MMRSNNPANTGKVTRLTMLSDLQAATETQLLTVTFPEPQQLSCTVLQSTSTANPSPPWNAASVDNANTYGPVPQDFNAPDAPVSAGVWALRCRLRWGIGGASTVAIFDYPAMGATFSFLAQSMNLDALWYNGNTNTFASPTFANVDAVPFVGAFVGPAQPGGEETPIRYRERSATIASPQEVYYAVKSHARRCRVTCLTEGAVNLKVDFATKQGVLLQRDVQIGTATSLIDRVYEVPMQAAIVRVTNNSALALTVIAVVEWQMGFS